MVCLLVQAFPINETMIRAGDYGQALVIVLQGTVRVYRDTSQYPIVPVDGEERPAELSETVSYDDREPIVGFSSCLTNKQYGPYALFLFVCQSQNRHSTFNKPTLPFADTAAWVSGLTQCRDAPRTGW